LPDAVHAAISALMAVQPWPQWFNRSLLSEMTSTGAVEGPLASISTAIDPLFTTAPLPVNQAATWPIQPLSAVFAYNIASTILNRQLPLPPQAQAELVELHGEPLNAEGEPIQFQVTMAVSSVWGCC